MTPERHGFIHDEAGARSMGRLLLAATTLYIFAAIGVDTFTTYKVTGAGWALLTTMEGAFTIWVAGTKMAAYLSPVVQKGIDAVKDAIAKRREGRDGTESTP